MSTRHIHLDPLGGIAGDMFIAAMLDAFPALRPVVIAAAESVSGASCALLPYQDGLLAGKRFAVRPTAGTPHVEAHVHEPDLPPQNHFAHEHHPGSHPAPGHHTSDQDHGCVAERTYQMPDRRTVSQHAESLAAASHAERTSPPHDHHEAHDAHTHWRDIRNALQSADLPAGVVHHAIGIFTLLAEAEGRVHGLNIDDVAFHEVGAADSIADILGAAALIDALGPATYSTSPLPLGSGQIKTAHGTLPVPAPATALLLEGMPVTDDGIPGERVTPTGAAIIRYLCSEDKPRHLRLSGTGVGFGTRRLPGRSNCLRILAFDVLPAAATLTREALLDSATEANSTPSGTAGIDAPAGATQPAAATPHRTLLVVTFEVDDQTPEDLAIGLDRLRAMEAVHDALIMPAFGKKNRMTTHVQILASPDAEEAVIAACFAQTTTIGLRTQHVSARALPRMAGKAAIDGGSIRLKSVRRPDGETTVKAEADDIAAGPTHAARMRLRRQAEETAG